MTSRKSHRTTAPPAAVVYAIQHNKPIPNDLLMDWYQNRAPEWIRKRKIAPDLAVFLWNAPSPEKWGHMHILFDERSK